VTRIVVASAAMARAVAVTVHTVGRPHGAGLVVRVVVSVLAGVIVYVGGAVLLRIDEITTLLHVRRRAS
jgi:hypothetical protein